MKNFVLATVVGRTDPIRSEHDGPILHIVRHYRPQKVYLILTREIEIDESEYHYNERAIHLVDEKCEVECVRTDIEDAHSYDNISSPILKICSQIRSDNPECQVLLNITSGTPQMETVLCMIALSDMKNYLPVQVDTPEKRSNRTSMFNPRKDLIEEWFECNLDNEIGAPNRCHSPALWNFRQPIIRFQIESLLKNHDYAGAYQIYLDNRNMFSENAGKMLEHAKYRLNLEDDKARKLARELGKYKELYPVVRSDICRLIEYFNSMQIKRDRGELNDFALRLEIMIVNLGIFMLEKCMGIPLENIANKSSRKDSTIYRLDEKKCNAAIPGIGTYMDQVFSDTGAGRYEWGHPLNARSIVYVVKFVSEKERYKEKYGECADDMISWLALSSEVRNPAAHTIIAITENDICQSYKNKDSQALCQSIRKVLIRVFQTEARVEAFDIYEKINDLCMKLLEE